MFEIARSIDISPTTLPGLISPCQAYREVGSAAQSCYIIRFNGVHMSTTTIRLPEELKARIASAAERTGKTTHSFILEALAEKADSEELRTAFEAEADARFANILSTGKTIPWADMRQYLEERADGKQPPRPVAKTSRA